MFDYLNYKNRIPLDKCIVPIPRLNPLSINYDKFWIHTMKRKQIEGHWVEHNGDFQWMPGPIFQYVNLWTIELKKKEGSSKGKVLGKPRLRDLEWIKGFVHAACRGFSGFKDDDEYSSHIILINPELEELLPYQPKTVIESLYNSKGELKKYKPALESMYEYKDKCLGKPLYHNYAFNNVDIEARNLGKSFISANFSGHNFLTDGVMDFDEWLENKNKPEGEVGKEIYTTQTLIGAIDSKYSSGVCSKIKIGLSNLPGKQEIAGILYPPPLDKKYKGSWESGKDIIAKYKKKIAGRWVDKGTGSGFLHRSFNDNPFAANGTRYGFGVLDEIGFHYNLIATLGQLAECTTADGGEKYGTIWMTGTGGDMDGGATEAVKKVFYRPKDYDCYEFDDIFENTGKKIGFFVPAWMSFDKYRDELGNVNKDLAMRDLLKEREQKIKGDKKGYNDLLQMKPLKPSEAFLVSGGNIFDRPELTEWIRILETDGDGYIKGRVGSLLQNPDKTIEFKDDFTGKVEACDYPLEESHDKTGAPVIWEEPIKDPSYGYYIATLDPYAQDEAVNSVSLGSMGIWKRQMVGGSFVDSLVAEYTGRPETMDEFFDNCKKLMLLYNAHCLYENNYNHFKTFMQNRNLLHMLFKSPTALKNNKLDAIANTYGLRMTNAGGHGLKEELELYARDHLFGDAGDGKLNLHYIYSLPLLKELKAYNDVGNYDRAIMYFLFVAQKIQMARIITKTKEESKKKWWNNHKFNGV
jgi:hypothetical protein